MAEISVGRSNWRKWSTFAPTWERIHTMCPDASFFFPREWVDCWLATFGEDLNPDLLAFAKDGDVVGCCLLVWRTQWVRGIPLRRVYLNCAGENDADSTCIEFNSLLSLPEYEEPVAKALVTFLRRRKWDELLLPGVVERDAIRILAGSLGANEVTEAPSPYIDFMGFRDPPVDFLGSLSQKTRKHIRRTQRSYEEIGGACALRVAQSAEEALGMLRQLAELHQARWKGLGHAGAFSSPSFTGFHELMIRREFDSNPAVPSAGWRRSRWHPLLFPVPGVGVLLSVRFFLRFEQSRQPRPIDSVSDDRPLPGAPGIHGIRSHGGRSGIQAFFYERASSAAMDRRAPAHGAKHEGVCHSFNSPGKGDFFEPLQIQPAGIGDGSAGVGPHRDEPPEFLAVGLPAQ